MATVVYSDPQNPQIVPVVQGSIREDASIPAYVSPLDVDLLTNKPTLPSIDYTNLDFSSIKLQLLNLLKANAKTFGYSARDFSDANTTGMFLNMTAYMGQMISYHADSMVNELFLDTSQSSWSTFRLLNMYGYKPTRPQPGVILLSIIRRPSSNFNPDVRDIENNSEVMFSNSLGRKRFSFGSESYEIFPAKESNGTLVPDLLGDFVIPAYVSVDNPDNPDYEIEELQKNMHLCFGLTGKTVVEDFVSNGTENQIIRLGSGPVNNSKIIVQVEDTSVPKTPGKTVYKIWDELTYLSLAGFRTATRVGTSLDGKTPYLAASFKLSPEAYKAKQQNRLRVGTLMSVDYNNVLNIAKFQAYKDLLVPYNTCIITNLTSEKYNSEEYVDVLLYHPSYVYGEAPQASPVHGTQSTLINYVYNNGAKIQWEPGDVLYLLEAKDVGNRNFNGTFVVVKQPQIITLF